MTFSYGGEPAPSANVLIKAGKYPGFKFEYLATVQVAIRPYLSLSTCFDWLGLQAPSTCVEDIANKYKLWMANIFNRAERVKVSGYNLEEDAPTYPSFTVEMPNVTHFEWEDGTIRIENVEHVLMHSKKLVSLKVEDISGESYLMEVIGNKSLESLHVGVHEHTNGPTFESWMPQMLKICPNIRKVTILNPDCTYRSAHIHYDLWLDLISNPKIEKLKLDSVRVFKMPGFDYSRPKGVKSALKSLKYASFGGEAPPAIPEGWTFPNLGLLSCVLSTHFIFGPSNQAMAAARQFIEAVVSAPSANGALHTFEFDRDDTTIRTLRDIGPFRSVRTVAAYGPRILYSGIDIASGILRQIFPNAPTYSKRLKAPRELKEPSKYIAKQ
jgi:hypothetical protein